MYRDFAESILQKRQPEMSIENALRDHLLMKEIYAANESISG